MKYILSALTLSLTMQVMALEISPADIGVVGHEEVTGFYKVTSIKIENNRCAGVVSFVSSPMHWPQPVEFASFEGRIMMNFFDVNGNRNGASIGFDHEYLVMLLNRHKIPEWNKK